MSAPPPTRYDTTRTDVDALVEQLGLPRYRATQIWEALHAPRPLDVSTALPRALRDQLAERLPPALVEAAASVSHDTMTSKWLWTCAADGAQVETVLMRSPKRTTVCVSSQAGCAMACTFCATGQAGFERHLSEGEIVEQVARASHAAPERVSNVVFMGMGEPLANYDATVGALHRLHDDFGISARRLTVSTVGVVPAMRRLAAEPLPVTLAVSLHAPDDELRSRLVPLNRRYPIAAVLDAAADFAGAKGRRITFEYAGIAGVNDRPDQADRLATLLRGFPGAGGVHVNLIPLNPTAGYPGGAAPADRLRHFADRLRARGITATVRRNRGTDIDAACGQLRARVAIPDPATPSARMHP